MPTSAPLACYRFGRFELQVGQRRLLAAGKVVPLGARAFDLLVALVEGAGKLVTKDELLERVWSKLVVEEGNLPVQVSALRKVVGTEAIENVLGHGYRFTLEVKVVDTASASVPDSAPATPHNLPRQLTSYVGNHGDVEQCIRLLQKSRLLTLTGIGGLGKTRLSLELGQALLHDYPDGIWMVELAPLSDAGLVAQVVASVLGIMEQPGGQALKTLMNHVSSRRMLIILDNCEHLRRACAQVALKLLEAGPGVKMLASSREALHVPGETIFTLSSLSAPALQQMVPMENVTEYDAVRLFVDRATKAHSAFKLSKTNAAAVCNICARLDGIPLAIELAAARTRVVSVDAIAQRLNDLFRLLKGSDNSVLPRQQTLRAAIDWSYDLLSSHEQTLFNRLAVFRGGWTLEAAESVCGSGAIEAVDVLDLNGYLIEKSLVVMDPEGMRYRMLETVRQYAQERLDASNEVEAIKTRHLDYFLLLAEGAAKHLVGPDEASTDRIEFERDNFRSAYAWCDRVGGGAETAMRLASALAAWICRGFIELGNPIMGELLARPGVQTRNLVRCNALLAATFISYYRGQYDDARRYGEEGLSIAREIGATAKVANALKELGIACLGQDDRVSARRYLVEGLALARVGADKGLLIDALNALAELLSNDGELDAAEALYEEALQVAYALGARNWPTLLLLNLARISISRGSTQRAGKHLRDAMTIFMAIGSALNAHALLAFSAALAALYGDSNRAARLYGASERQLQLLGLRREPADEAVVAIRIAQAREASDPAMFAAAEAAGRALGWEDAMAYAQTWVDSMV